MLITPHPVVAMLDRARGYGLEPEPWPPAEQGPQEGWLIRQEGTKHNWEAIVRTVNDEWQVILTSEKPELAILISEMDEWMWSRYE